MEKLAAFGICQQHHLYLIFMFRSHLPTCSELAPPATVRCVLHHFSQPAEYHRKALLAFKLKLLDLAHYRQLLRKI